MTRVSTTALACAAALTIAGAVRGSLLAQTKAKPSVTKQAMLDGVAKNVLAPGYADLAAKCAALTAAAQALTSTPNAVTLKGAQQAWTAALLAWRRTQAFVHGPIDELGVYGRIQFWPSRRQSVDRVLRANRPIDDPYLQELGANAVGLSALEVLLFDPRLDDAARIRAFSGPQAERQRQYFLALTRDLERKARQVAQAWQGASGYAAKFGGGGQQALNLLVNDMLDAIESGAQGRLQIVLERNSEPQFRTEIVEGAASGTSQQGVLALLTGARAAFTGGDGPGVDDYLKTINAATAARIDTQFARTIAAVQALEGPLEDAIAARAKKVQIAHDACRSLEVMLKTEVASTLGVTLTFKSKDGD